MGRLFALVLVAASCTATPDEEPFDGPASLKDTGLCVDDACKSISSDARAYTPRFELWADSATKRRWLYLPPGSKIDTSDMDYWVFPVGTKVWKEFTRDGVRVETRFIEKRLPDDDATDAWFYATYIWNKDQTAATPTIKGRVDANGTDHDVPSREDCLKCHEGLRPSRVLGIQAIELDRAAPAGELDLDDLIAANALSAPPSGTTPHFPIPGNDVDRAALGYLHGNCGHCHNRNSITSNQTMLQLRLDTAHLQSVTATPTYQTGVGVPGEEIIDNGVLYSAIIRKGDPDRSLVVYRMSSTDKTIRMPPLSTQLPDTDGIAAVRAWIQALQ